MEPLLLQAEVAEIDIQYLYALFSHLKRPKDKITYLIKQGDLISVKRGLYVIAPKYGKRPSTKVLANMMYHPSYLSMHSALKFYELIPEAIHGETSVAYKRTKTFQTAFGEFSYHSSNNKYDYQWGQVTEQIDEKRSIRIATPLKAIYDLIRYHYNACYTASIEDIIDYLVSLRLDITSPSFDIMDITTLSYAQNEIVKEKLQSSLMVLQRK